MAHDVRVGRKYLEGFYNRTRRHSRLGMLSPADYEAAHAPLAHAKSVHNLRLRTAANDDNP